MKGHRAAHFYRAKAALYSFKLCWPRKANLGFRYGGLL